MELHGISTFEESGGKACAMPTINISSIYEIDEPRSPHAPVIYAAKRLFTALGGISSTSKTGNTGKPAASRVICSVGVVIEAEDEDASGGVGSECKQN